MVFVKITQQKYSQQKYLKTLQQIVLLKLVKTGFQKCFTEYSSIDPLINRDKHVFE